MQNVELRLLSSVFQDIARNIIPSFKSFQLKTDNLTKVVLQTTNIIMWLSLT